MRTATVTTPEARALPLNVPSPGPGLPQRLSTSSVHHCIVLPRHLFRCDNRCSEKILSFWQFASVVTYTTNLNQHRYNENHVARGDKTLTNWQWYEFVENKPHRGRLWKMKGKEQYIPEMWEYYCRERSRVRNFREEAQKEKQAGIQGQWQHESPARENLEQATCCNDTHCTQRMMK